MPLSVNVGLSRKASANYQSAGVSINLAAELDQTLLERPEELQRRIADILSDAEALASLVVAYLVDDDAPPKGLLQPGTEGDSQHPAARRDDHRAAASANAAAAHPTTETS